MVLFCDPCAQQGKKHKADKFCPKCENELFCEPCCNAHRAQKFARNHSLNDISNYEIQTKGNTVDTDTNLLCEPCHIQGRTNLAVLYCPVCENELFCKDCASNHTAQRLTKTHVMHDISILDSNVELKHQDDNPAFMFCPECENELLCNDCANNHRVQRSTKTHILQDVKNKSSTKAFSITEHTTTLLCEICSEKKKSNFAISYCPQCENELLCQECASNHKVQRSTKQHSLQDIKDLDKIYPLEAKNNNKTTELVYTRESNDEHHHADNRKSHSSHELTSRLIKNLDTNHRSTQHDSHTPGQPKASNIGFDTITLTWEAPEIYGPDDYFQISFKTSSDGPRWKFYDEKCAKATLVLINLKSNTEFVFRIRAVYSESEGQYSETSQVIKTHPSPASHFVASSELIFNRTAPFRYRLPMNEISKCRNDVAKSKKFELGSPTNRTAREKTILLIGETGTGKSTLVDAIINYILGVNWDDPFRFTIGTLDKERKEKNQANSQTEWINCYTVHPVNGSRLAYSINIIDTPGFGDTRGLDRDQEIVEQIRQLFCATPPHGLITIDIVCCTVKAPDARLTIMQTYVFNAVMSLFGKDIEENICSLITFADSRSPPVLSALTQSGLPFGKHFTFNNTALFAENTSSDAVGPSPKSFWDMGIRSFTGCFEHIKRMPPKSLQLTKEVLDERHRLDETLQMLQPKLEIGLLKISQLKHQIQVFKDNKSRIDENKDFEYMVKITKQTKEPLAEGLHTTNCLFCNVTCHENCAFADDKDKMKCVAMDGTGHCKQCKNKCIWSQHANTPYIFKYTIEEEKHMYSEMKSKYEEANGKIPTLKQLLDKLGVELNDIADNIEGMMVVVRNCNTRLGEIALHPNPMTMTQYIDMMIQNEKSLHKDGWNDRIDALYKLRKRAQVQADAVQFDKETGHLGLSGGTTDPQAVLARFHDLIGI
ncbi:hypothetical protein DPMN_123755 [Dreissena polymorpha]|uniref:Fibronectin type-III domain-containing protein n=1 Tax=Dreissena polymorpha TaxID=45954 RepID=A0A9D4GQY5_DREPO|nr:hypothetical protein DPMN_123755 [Dreissena polymorpha]